MCLALPGKIVQKQNDHGVIDLAGNRYNVNLVMTPEARLGDYVLVHAGYAIQIVDADEAKQTWDILAGFEGGDEQ